MPDTSPLARPTACAAILLAAFFVFGSLGVSLAASTSEAWGAGSADQRPTVRILEEGPVRLRLEFELPVLSLTDLSAEGTTFQDLAIPEGGESGEVGQPALPIFARLIALPDEADARCTVRVLEEEERGGLRLRPVQDNAQSPFAYDREAYGRDGFDGTPWVQLGSPAILRGVRVAPITFAPVRYNPAQGTVKVARRLEVVVDFQGTNPTNPHPRRPLPLTPSFAALQQELVLNSHAGVDKAAAGDGMWLVICRDDSNVRTRLQPLVEWRRRKGHPVYLATTTETGTTKEAIKTFIQTAYDSWANPPEYVVLAGDAVGTYAIPTWHENVTSYQGEGDHPYVQLEGNDLLADAHVGRLSFGTLSELETIVTKTVSYESTPYLTDSSWFTRSCLTGDPNDSGYSTVQVMQWLKVRQLELGYTQIDTIFADPFVSQMATALNRGDTYFFYRGIQGMSGWGNSNTYALTNGWKLPFCVVVTCDTGSFEDGTSRSEGFLRAGTATSPRGGVGAIGTATTGTHTRFNNCYMFGLGWGAYYHDAWQMGAAHTWGKVNLFLNYAATQNATCTAFTYWNNLMGDPAGEIWTGVPQPLTVIHPSTLPVGTNSVVIHVAKDGLPCAGARVCLYQSNIVETQIVGYTDAMGAVDLVIPPAAVGSFQLTVTKHNCRPYLTDIQIVGGDFVGHVGHLVDDDSSGESKGDGDGLIAPAEWIELPVDVHNYGSSTATAVTGLLHTDDPYTTILDATEDFGDVAAGGTVTSTGDFGFAVARGCPDGHVIRLWLTLSSGLASWESAFDLEVHAPAVAYSALHLSGAGGNGLLDPGETVGLSVALQNVGDVTALQPAAALVSESSYLTIDDPLGSYPMIGPGLIQENTGNTFTLTAASSCPNGYLAPLRLLVEFTGGVRDTVDFHLTVGTAVTTDPLGPDLYGYWAFDNTDTAYPDAPTYSWVEISPSLGGDGTQILLGDYGEYQDKSRTVALPFAFNYYGQTYTSATICSNGWIVMGATYLTDYRNWTLPSPGGPNGAIAVFWDDLYEVNSTPGHVYQKYDASGHRWIVEWSRLRNAVGLQTETFEAIFYDPAFHPTVTGDGIIEFQYSTVNNVDTTDEYATVGIERPDNSDGLTYSYFNRYPASAPTLTSGRAIRFVPKRETPSSVTTTSPATFGFDPATPNPFHPGQAIRLSLPERAQAELAVYDAQGRLVRTIHRGTLPAGATELRWDGRNARGAAVPSGLYFLRVSSADRSSRTKLLLLAQ